MEGGGGKSNFAKIHSRRTHRRHFLTLSLSDLQFSSCSRSEEMVGAGRGEGKFWWQKSAGKMNEKRGRLVGAFSSPPLVMELPAHPTFSSRECWQPKGRKKVRKKKVKC